ncbi:processed acidic surface protein [Alkalicoccobacillus murimartini]|uniref:Processed acidic surface protein n=1 Tax=Alkalicoccobacillus murimartini TaxID=171685 RepID=A0ABT9YHB2_9BACI|nr:processed acidic surface protein [Alkalicoccobacillus murimartini]MDQ0207086.1 processed acidic surface protein [Alkalicoccobacillus murimartini]
MKRFVSMFLVIALLVFSVPSISFAAVSDEELEILLTDKNITREQLDSYLADFFDLTVDDFDDYEFLYWFVWTVDGDDPDEGIPYIEHTLGNFGITYDELVALLAENDKTINDFVFIEELDTYLFENYEWEWDEEWPEEPYYEGFFTEFGFTYKELDNLFEHLFKIIEENPESVEKLSALADRLEAFDGFESSTELTAEEIAELFLIGTELIDVLKIDAQFFLAKPGEQKPISFADLMQLTKIEGYDLLIVLNDLDGNKLADFIITAEMFNGKTVNNAGGQIDDAVKETEKEVENKTENENKAAPTPPAKDKTVKTEKKAAKSDDTKKTTAKSDSGSSKKVTKTVDGAKMPKTATSYPTYTLIGLLVTLGGVFLFRRFNSVS